MKIAYTLLLLSLPLSFVAAQSDCSSKLRNLKNYLDTVTVFDDCFRQAGARYVQTPEFKEIAKNYTIADEYLRDYPELIYLVINSRSIEDPAEKQNWFNLMPLMNEEQMTKLGDILKREKFKLREIELRYEARKEEIKRKYLEKWLATGSENPELCDLSSNMMKLDAMRKVSPEKELEIEELEFNMWSECGQNTLVYAKENNTLPDYEKAFYYHYSAITQPRKKFNPDKSLDELFQNMVSALYAMRRFKQEDNAENSRYMLQYAVDLTDMYESKKALFASKTKTMARIYGNMSWYYLFTREFNKAIEAGEKGFDMDNTNLWIKTNVGHGYLLTGRYAEAMKVYDSIKNTVDTVGGSNKPMGEVLLEDFDLLEKAGIQHPDIERVRRHLKR